MKRKVYRGAFPAWLAILVGAGVGSVFTQVRTGDAKTQFFEALKTRELSIVTKKGVTIAKISSTGENAVRIVLGLPQRGKPRMTLAISELQGTPVAQVTLYTPGQAEGSVGNATLACSSGRPRLVIDSYGGGQKRRSVVVGGSRKHPGAAIELRSGASDEKWPK
ncbi:MAG: hypothetical protein O6650_03815 [Actinobacteria bacterium]|nr:hypothetical protein [Actinomycetota bacterium]